VAWLLVMPRDAGAEWQFKPYLGVTFAPSTTFFGDLEGAAGSTREGQESGSANVVFGGSAALLGDVFGIEGDFGYAPGFFQTGDQDLVLSSSALTFTGNVVVALSRRITQYTLRPYLVGGAGLMRLRSIDQRNFFPIHDTLAAVDVGGGASGFFNERIGVNWDLRYFRSVGGEVTGDPNVTIDGLAKQLSFWRANMALVLRY
jgi:hypothetical protein